jgi:glycosyltransferase involved in cell wall biosynthesis/predicted O-methyltransferase YrrM
MKIRIVENLEQFQRLLGLARPGSLLETDLDVVENDTEAHGRKRRDAEVLCSLSANATRDVLELGTSHGRGAFKMASNLAPGLRCHTVNILPEQYDRSGGQMITHLISKEDIGSFYRDRGVRNVVQYFANTARWTLPAELQNLDLVFVDAAHDEENVYLDSRLVWDRIAPGGFLVWHDFSPSCRHFDWISASMRGAERFVHDLGLESLEVVNLRNSWCGVLRKPLFAEPAIIPESNIKIREAADLAKDAIAGATLHSLRFAIVYPSYSADRDKEEAHMADSLSRLGFSVEAIGIPCPGGWWHFPQLDEQWRRQSRELLRAYDQVEERLRQKDVLIASGASMLHPEFIRRLSTFNVLICADDPESSETLSRPVAPSFDFSFPLNIACVDDYRRWGCRHVDWLFHPIRPELSASELTEASILEGHREHDISLLCERVFNLSDRAQRIEHLVKSFPQAFIRGPGWPHGPVPAPDVYRNTKIGWNLHNSIGPCNSRSTMLPAFGVMQICDNASHFGKMFELDREGVGFESLEECIEKTRYYLNHDQERRQIAAAGWRRAMRDYTLERWWEKITSSIEPRVAEKLRRNGSTDPIVVRSSGSETRRIDIVAPGTTTKARNTGHELMALRPDGEKPRVLMLVDRRGWAYDTAARAISKRLADEFEFRIAYVRENPDLTDWAFDLIYVFFWGETYHHRFGIPAERVLKEISSHRWANEEAYGRLTPDQMAGRYLSDATTLTATSKRLQALFDPVRTTHWCPNGYEPELFSPRGARSGPLRIGWAGNRNDPCKGLRDILEPAAGGDFELLIAGGDLDATAMGRFYQSIDVLCIASTAEGEPLTLVEGMASGVFPVTVDVGIVPELVRHEENGLIVERRPAAFRAAFQWCRLNPDHVRAAGLSNARRMAQDRRWDDVSIHWRRALRTAWHRLPEKALPKPVHIAALHERNLGIDLGQWPERAKAAADAITALRLPSGASVVDMGCGHQTLKPLLPPGLDYFPVDRIARGPGVRILDLARELPTERYTVATFLGVFEYFEDTRRLLRWCSEHVGWLVVSFNDCSNPARRSAQNWRCQLGLEPLLREFSAVGGELVDRIDLGRAEHLYIVEFKGAPGLTRSQKPAKRIALLSAAVNGDNSGDALIVDATRRILVGHELVEFPLLQPLDAASLERVNACDAAVICGTNLYQHVFACPLNPEIIGRFKVPIIPLGVGASAPIGRMPAMDPLGQRSVRMIHERCAIGSVRDGVSLEFVRGLGIRNVELTGCPVLFHGLQEPRFSVPSSERLVLSVRARLLHVEDQWSEKQTATLRRLCREFRPTLLLQSPYDVPLATRLAKEFGLECLQDSEWGATPMIEGVTRATRTAGFRLHFGMLSLAHGKPATFLATDTRTSGFCDMVGVPWHAVQTYRDEDLLAEISGPQPGQDRFLINWRSLRSAMASVLEANGINHALAPLPSPTPR